MDHSNGTNGAAKRPYTALTLDRAREATPAPAGPGAWAAQLKEAAKQALGEQDVAAIVQKQVELAKGGDPAAVKFVMGFIASQAPPPPPPKEIKIIEKVKVVGDRVRRSKRVRGGDAPRRVEPSEPAALAPVAVDSPGLRQLRKLVGLHLAANGASSLAALEQVLEVPADQLRAVLNCPWFADQKGAWALTPEGNQHCR